MITLTQAERLARKITEALAHPASDMQPDKLAQDYADLCRAVNRRLEQCAMMIKAGQSFQALQLAETPPPVLDLITVLSFRQSSEWRAYCQAHHLPWSEPFYDKHLQLLNSAYGNGIPEDHAFYRDYRRAVMKNDDERALSILRVIARMNPADGNTKEELKRVEEKVLRSKLEKLRQVVATGDSVATQAQVAEIEASGVAAPLSHPVWQQAQVARCQELLRRAEECRKQDAWQDAEVLVEDIHSLATQYNVQLPAADADAWSSLEGWTLEKRGAYAEDQDFQRALAALEYEVQTLETKRATAAPLRAVEAKDNFNSLAAKWSGAGRFDRPLDETLLARCEECRDWLQGRMKAAHARHRVLTVIAALVILGAMAAAVPFVLDWAKERDLVLRLGMHESFRHVSDAEALIATMPAKLKTNARVAEAVAKAKTFIAREKELKQSLDDDLQRLKLLADAGFNGATEQAGPLRAQAGQALAKVAPEYKPGEQSALDAWDARWQPVRNAALSTELDRAGQIAARLDGTSGFDAVHDALAALQSPLSNISLLTNEPPALDRNLELRLGELNAKATVWTRHADQWEKARARLEGAPSLGEYLDRLGQLVQSPFATAAQRDGAAEIDRLKINQETLLGELLLPNDRTAWDSLTNVGGWQTNLMPAEPTPEEKDAYLKLRDDKNMQNVYAYELITNDRPGNQLRSHPVFVQGAMAPNRGGQMAGVVYDPAASPDAARFFLQAYSDWDYSSVKKLSLTYESAAYARLGLGELIDANSGNYQKPILQLLDQLNQDDNSSGLFRAFVTLKLFDLASLRPQEWGLQWCPGAASYIQGLKDLGAGELKSGDWMVRDQSIKYDQPFQAYFARTRGVPLEKQARLLQQLARAACEADFTYAGFIDSNGHPALRQISAAVPEYWGWDVRSRTAVLLLRGNGGGAPLVKTAEPLPFTPLFVFNGDRRLLFDQTARSVSYPFGQMAGFLPPFFSGL